MMTGWMMLVDELLMPVVSRNDARTEAVIYRLE